MKLNYITMLVRDIEKSIDFYQRAVEMHVVRRFHPEIGRIVFMSDAEESITLEFIQPEKNIETVETKGIVMSYSAKGRLEEKHGQLARWVSPFRISAILPQNRDILPSRIRTACVLNLQNEIKTEKSAGAKQKHQTGAV